jgi:hypothetical protein
LKTTQVQVLVFTNKVSLGDSGFHFLKNFSEVLSHPTSKAVVVKEAWSAKGKVFIIWVLTKNIC